ncbi:MAG TPA: hypothetical protein VFS94_06080 [Gemmatimonadales bacterium]|nr:hypothetical protein [Gemmatimonadales bacterium]
MRPTSRLAGLLLVALAACSDIAGTDSGVVVLEVIRPDPASVEVGETLQLHSRALDASGAVVPDAVITWASGDTTITLDGATGLVTGRFVGPARVQAAEGTLSSQPVTIAVLARADSLAVQLDTLIVLPTETVSPPLVAHVLTRSDTAASGFIGAEDHTLVATIVQPVFGDPASRTVQFTGGVLADTSSTDVAGAPAPAFTLSRIEGQTAPDTVLVEFTVARPSGTPVPGSGGRIAVVFQ